jgi:hypothetical protein
MVLFSLAIALLRSLRACFRSQREQALVELAPRQQLAFGIEVSVAKASR